MPGPDSLRKRETQQLRRLETLVDSVFALVLVVLVIELPYPENVGGAGGSIWSFLSAHNRPF